MYKRRDYVFIKVWRATHENIRFDVMSIIEKMIRERLLAARR